MIHIILATIIISVIALVRIAEKQGEPDATTDD